MGTPSGPRQTHGGGLPIHYPRICGCRCLFIDGSSQPWCWLYLGCCPKLFNQRIHSGRHDSHVYIHHTDFLLQVIASSLSLGRGPASLFPCLFWTVKLNGCWLGLLIEGRVAIELSGGTCLSTFSPTHGRVLGPLHRGPMCYGLPPTTSSCWSDRFSLIRRLLLLSFPASTSRIPWPCRWLGPCCLCVMNYEPGPLRRGTSLEEAIMAESIVRGSPEAIPVKMLTGFLPMVDKLIPVSQSIFLVLLD